jgi:hypothetical protein
MKRRHAFLSACTLAVAAAFAPSVARAQTPVRFSGAASVAMPVGDLGNSASAGYSLALRGEGRLWSPNWSFRGDLSWDRFSGRGDVDAYSYLGAAGNLVHRSSASRVYEFGGLGMYGSTTAFTNQSNLTATDLGFQTGVGVNFDSGPHTPFVEFGVTNVFTSGRNSVWFPVRFGIRF